MEIELMVMAVMTTAWLNADGNAQAEARANQTRVWLVHVETRGLVELKCVTMAILKMVMDAHRFVL